MRKLALSLYGLLLTGLLLGCGSTQTQSKVAAEPAAPAVQAVPITAAAAAPGAPAIEVLETSFNFGDMQEGIEYVHEFKVRNAGSGVLEIRKISPG